MAKHFGRRRARDLMGRSGARDGGGQVQRPEARRAVHLRGEQKHSAVLRRVARGGARGARADPAGLPVQGGVRV